MNKGNQSLPFCAALMTARERIPAGDGRNYNVHVFPKNKIKPGTDIDKFVTELENKHDTADIFESVNWIIEITLPDDMATCKDYTVTEPSTANSQTLTVRLTATCKQTAAKSLPNKEDISATLNIELNTLVNKNAEGCLGRPIPNGATIHYINNLDIVFEPQSV